MLKSVRISQYRGFRSLDIEGLTQVTLLVGPNNAGKTSALEAIELLLEGRLPRALLFSPLRRGELIYTSEAPSRDADISHLFHGHGVAVGSRFEIKGENEHRHIQCEIVREANPPPADKEPRQSELPLSQELNKAGETLSLLVKSDRRGEARVSVSEDGAVSFEHARRKVLSAEQEPVACLYAFSEPMLMSTLAHSGSHCPRPGRTTSYRCHPDHRAGHRANRGPSARAVRESSDDGREGKGF